MASNFNNDSNLLFQYIFFLRPKHCKCFRKLSHYSRIVQIINNKDNPIAMPRSRSFRLSKANSAEAICLEIEFIIQSIHNVAISIQAILARGHHPPCYRTSPSIYNRDEQFLNLFENTFSLLPHTVCGRSEDKVVSKSFKNCSSRW